MLKDNWNEPKGVNGSVVQLSWFFIFAHYAVWKQQNKDLKGKNYYQVLGSFKGEYIGTIILSCFISP